MNAPAYGTKATSDGMKSNVDGMTSKRDGVTSKGDGMKSKSDVTAAHADGAKRVLLIALALVVACAPDPGDSARTGSMQLAVTTAALFDVAYVEFKIVDPAGSCADPAIATKIVAIEEEGLPIGNLGGDGHPFADGLFVLPVGDYLACITPVQDNNNPPTPSAFCAPASKSVTVIAGQTEEIILISQCGGDDNGGLDVVFAFNTAPHIDDLVIQPSKFIQTCEQASMHLTATDVDEDDLTYHWEIVNPPVGTMPSLTFDQDGNATFSTDDAGDYEIRVTVTDEWMEIETLTFPIHVSGMPCVAPGAVWMAAGAGAAEERIQAITSDDGGNVYAAGMVPAAICTIGVQNCVATESIFVIKTDPDGSALWLKQLGNFGEDEARALAVAENGDIFVAGTFEGVVDFGCGEQEVVGSTGTDVFLIRLAGADGSCVWGEVFGGVGDDYVGGLGISKNPSGQEQVTIGGYFFSATFSVPGFLPMVNQGFTDLYLIRRRADDGGPVWHRHDGGAGIEILGDLSVDEDGNIALAGAFFGAALTLGVGATAITVPSAGDYDGFVARLSSNGYPTWLHTANAPVDDYRTGVDFDSLGNVLSSGYISGALADAFVIKRAADGAFLWTAAANASSSAVATRVVADAFGNAHVFGYFDGTIDFGTGVLTANGPQDLFLTSLSAATGAALWSVSGGSTAVDLGNALHIDNEGNHYVGGAFGDGGTGFSFAGSPPYDNNGSFDLFYGKLSP